MSETPKVNVKAIRPMAASMLWQSDDEEQAMLLGLMFYVLSTLVLSASPRPCAPPTRARAPGSPRGQF